MAIAVTLDDLLHDRRMTLTELAERIGLPLANLSILKTGKACAIRFSTLEAICEALSCQARLVRTGARRTRAATITSLLSPLFFACHWAGGLDQRVPCLRRLVSHGVLSAAWRQDRPRKDSIPRSPQ
jgi:putative transcriptional regulator